MVVVETDQVFVFPFIVCVCMYVDKYTDLNDYENSVKRTQLIHIGKLLATDNDTVL